MKFKNQITDTFEFLQLSFGVIDIDRDMIIGYPAIYRYSLLYKLYLNFGGLEYLGKNTFLRRTSTGWLELPRVDVLDSTSSLTTLTHRYAPCEKSLVDVETIQSSDFWDTHPDDDGSSYNADAFDALYEPPLPADDKPSSWVHIDRNSDIQTELTLLVDRYRSERFPD